MIITQRQQLQLDNQTQTIVIPYLETQKVTKEWLRGLLPINEDCPVEALVQEGARLVMKIQSSWVSIQLLPIGNKKASIQENIKEAFGIFGKNIKTNCQIILDHLKIEGISQEDLIQLGTQAILEGAYSFKMTDQLASSKDVLSIIFVVEKDYEQAIKKGLVYGQAINQARTLSNLPNNYLHTTDFAAYAKQLGETYGLEVAILGDDQLEKLQCGGILSVNAGSRQEANLITLTYKGNPHSDELNALIGKGVMFDSGGYHLKSLQGMDGMKYDMCGAASVLGVMEIVAGLKMKTNVIAVIPAVENLINERATKMGDVIRTMSGQSVEVYNTDAEGRLILCDALTYAIKQGATRLIDLATLTYSCQAALGDEIAGIFSNHNGFYQEFMTHANKMGEKVWRLPLDPIYHELIRNTKTADLINYAPGYGAGASVAACFLESFVSKDLPWIHLDMVGPAVARTDKKHKEKGATGVLISSIASLIEG